MASLFSAPRSNPGFQPMRPRGVGMPMPGPVSQPRPRTMPGLPQGTVGPMAVPFRHPVDGVGDAGVGIPNTPDAMPGYGGAAPMKPMMTPQIGDPGNMPSPDEIAQAAMRPGIGGSMPTRPIANTPDVLGTPVRQSIQKAKAQLMVKPGMGMGM
jgi:hypothetical protein